MAEIIGLLIAIGALLAMLPGLMHWTVLGSEQIRDTAIAQQAGIFEKASEQYLAQNSGALLTTATATNPVIVTSAELQTGGFLPSNYTSTNVYDQIWELQVLQPTPGVLQAVAFTTGGQSLGDEEAARIAGLIGASGGFVPLNNSGAYPQAASLTAYGTQGAWTLALNNFKGVTKGELASYISLVDSTGQVTSNNYLYRYSVPGNSELNTMHTPLIMAAIESKGAACTSTGSIAQDGTGALLSCQAGVWAAVGNGSWKSPVGSYSALTALPASSNSIGDVRLTTDDSRAFAWTGSAWQALAVDQNGNLAVPAALTVGGSATVAGDVSSSGNISASGSISSGGTISNNGASIGSNGEIVSNSNTYGFVSTASGGQQSAAGSIAVNDSEHTAQGIQYPWYSQLSAQVYSNVQSINTLNNDLGIANNKIANNQSSINTINANLNSTNPCTGSSSYAYNALNAICEKAVQNGLNVVFSGNFGPYYSTTVSQTGYNRFINRTGNNGPTLVCVIGATSGVSPCSQTSTGPATKTISVPSGSAPELITVTGIMGRYNAGGPPPNAASPYGANWGTLSGYKGCSSGGSVIVTLNGSEVADIALSQQANADYYQYVIGEDTATFVIPAGGTATIQANQTCVGFSGSIWTL